MIAVRAAKATDVELILGFIKELAVYERAPEQVVATADLIHQGLFGPNANAKALIGEFDGKPAGFAVYFYSYSTWLGRHGINLEDLYVSPASRGHGIGKALLQHLAQQAVAENCGRLEWNVLDWNTPAIEFYQSLGAEALDEWTRYRVSGATLIKLAEPSQG